MPWTYDGHDGHGLFEHIPIAPYLKAVGLLFSFPKLTPPTHRCVEEGVSFGKEKRRRENKVR